MEQFKRNVESYRTKTLSFYKKIFSEVFRDDEWDNLKKLYSLLDDSDREEIIRTFLDNLFQLREAQEVLKKWIKKEEDLELLKDRVFKTLNRFLSLVDVDTYLTCLQSIGVAHYRIKLDPRLFLKAWLIFNKHFLRKLKEKASQKGIPCSAEYLDLLHRKNVFEIAIVIDIFWRGIIEKLIWTEQRAITDSLTKAYNRRFLEVILPKKLREEAKVDKYSVIMLDLDDFKEVNDRYGHLIGDLYLKFFAQEILKNFKRKDFFIRYGGDEFVIVLLDVGKRLAEKLMNRLSNTLRHIVLPNNLKLPLSFSWGIAEYPKDSTDIQELIKIADRRMYTRKRRKKSSSNNKAH